MIDYLDTRVLYAMIEAVRKNDPTYTADEMKVIHSELSRNVLSTAANIRENHDNLVLCQETFNLLPRLQEIKHIDSINHKFEEIEIKKNDSEELKKIIRKANYEFAGYSCQHKTMNKDWDLLNTYVDCLYKSPEFIEYRDFIDNILEIVIYIRTHDKIGEKWNDYDMLPTQEQIDTIINHIKILNDKIKSINDAREAVEHKMILNPTCPKCKAAQRKYDYIYKEIQRMRREGYE